MSRYTIKDDIIERVMRHSVDAAVHHAVERFSDQLGDQQSLAHRIARAAAENAVEQFKAWCNAELRLIEAEHERLTTAALLRPPRPFVTE